MSTGHDFQQLAAQKGGAVVTACRFCLCVPSDPKAKESCSANVLANMPPGSGPKSSLPLPPHVVTALAQVEPRPFASGSAAAIVQSLNAEAIESKITELKGELAALDVLLQAAKARDAKSKKEES